MRNRRQAPGMNAGSMADIAFLLLIFFLVSTTIQSEKGLAILLPPWRPEKETKELEDRNVFKILINYKDELLVEDEPYDIKNLKKDVKAFLSNNGKKPDLSDSPDDAVVSIKTDRGTSYKIYISVLDKVKAAYYELRANEIGIAVSKYMELEEAKTKNLTLEERKMLKKAKDAYPLQISEAEPTKVKVK